MIADVRRIDLMQNPFTPPLATGSYLEKERWVTIYGLASVALLCVSVLFSMPGLILLNQKLRWIPVRSEIYDVEINGKSVPLETAIWDSLMTGSIPAVIGVILGMLAILNYLHNRRLRKARNPVSVSV